MREKLKAFFSAIWSKISPGTFIIVCIGTLIFVVAKYRDILINLIVNASKRDMADTKKKDDALKAIEDNAKRQADDLVRQADDLKNGKTKVDEDWNK